MSGNAIDVQVCAKQFSELGTHCVQRLKLSDGERQRYGDVKLSGERRKVLALAVKIAKIFPYKIYRCRSPRPPFGRVS